MLRGIARMRFGAKVGSALRRCTSRRRPTFATGVSRPVGISSRERTARPRGRPPGRARRVQERQRHAGIGAEPRIVMPDLVAEERRSTQANSTLAPSGQQRDLQPRPRSARRRPMVAALTLASAPSDPWLVIRDERHGIVGDDDLRVRRTLGDRADEPCEILCDDSGIPAAAAPRRSPSARMVRRVGSRQQTVYAAPAPRSFAPTVRVTSVVPRFTCDSWVVATSAIVAPLQAAVRSRFVRDSASSSTG